MPILPNMSSTARPSAFTIEALMNRKDKTPSLPSPVSPMGAFYNIGMSPSATSPSQVSAAAAATAAAAQNISSMNTALLQNMKSLYESQYHLESLGLTGHLGMNPALAGSLASSLPGHPGAGLSAGPPPGLSHLLAGAGHAGHAMTRPEHFLLNPWLLAQHSSYMNSRFGTEGSLFLQPFRKPKRIRTAFSPSQLLDLEHAFDKNHYVVGQERKDLANTLDLTETQVKVWFQNRRTKFKRTKGDDGEDEELDVTESEEEEEERADEKSRKRSHDKLSAMSDDVFECAAQKRIKAEPFVNAASLDSSVQGHDGEGHNGTAS